MIIRSMLFEAGQVRLISQKRSFSSQSGINGSIPSRESDIRDAFHRSIKLSSLPSSYKCKHDCCKINAITKSFIETRLRTRAQLTQPYKFRLYKKSSIILFVCLCKTLNRSKPISNHQDIGTQLGVSTKMAWVRNL